MSSASNAIACTSEFLNALDSALADRTFRKVTLSVNAAENRIRDEEFDNEQLLTFSGDPLYRMRNVYGRVVEI